MNKRLLKAEIKKKSIRKSDQSVMIKLEVRILIEKKRLDYCISFNDPPPNLIKLCNSEY